MLSSPRTPRLCRARAAGAGRPKGSKRAAARRNPPLEIVFERMQKNILLAAGGLVLGFFVGFLITNSLTNPGLAGASVQASSPGGPRPLGPDQSEGELPPGHPDIGGAGAEAGNAGGSSAAATSASAQAAMEKADRDARDFTAQAEAAQIFYNARDYQKAVLYAGRALQLKPRDLDMLVLAGNAAYDDGRFEEAAKFYERALAVNPNSPDVRTDFGNTFFNRKDFPRAIAEYRKSVAIDPAHLNSWRNIAAAALQSGDKATAAEAVEKLSALDPNNPQLGAFRQKLAEMN
jgi:tetratricopeptide (TPR) repeat protein